MKRQNKWVIEHIVQGHYGGCYGWEDETSEETRKEALQRLREYRENMPQYPHRLIRRRVLNPAFAQPVA